MSKQPIRRSMSPTPSRTRVRGEIQDAGVREAQRIEHFEGPAVSLAAGTSRSRRAKLERTQKKDNLVAGLGSLAAVGMILFTVATNRGGDTAPLDVEKLPKSQVTRYIPPAGENPEEIARQVTNGNTDIDQLTAEIEAQIGDSSGLNEGMLLPNSQIDPSLIKK